MSCNQPKKKTVLKATEATISYALSIQRPAARGKTKENTDSGQVVKALSDALNYTRKHKKISFRKKLEVADDSARYCSSNYSILKYGHLFSTADQFLMVKTYFEGGVYFNVYRFTGKTYVGLISTDMSQLGFIGEAITDIDGDGQKDYIIHWYPSSGCCRRNVYNVYVYRAANKTFSPAYQFINPTFSPAEKLIRGVTYDHPGLAALYKYRWSKQHIDTIEYVYAADTVKNLFSIARSRSEQDCPQKRKTVTKVPREYRHIRDYDWFIDY